MKMRTKEELQKQMEGRFYIGTKYSTATPMTRLEYNELRGWAVPDNENPSDEGYIVANIKEEPNVEGLKGYITWSPKEHFEQSFKPLRNKVSKDEVLANMQEVICDTRWEFGKPVTYVTVRMLNGFTIRESTTCVDPQNYDEEIGRSICLEKIEDRIWWLLGYELQTEVQNFLND